MFGKKKKTGIDPRTGVDYEKLGRTIEGVFVRDYIELLGSTRRQIWSSFVRGIFMGLGTVIGATLVVALVLALLNFLGGAPFIGHFIQSIADNIHHK